jgi:hypothetical protein
MIICYCVAIGLMGAYWVVAAWKNKKAISSDIPLEHQDTAEQFLDQTDFEQKEFIYTT